MDYKEALEETVHATPRHLAFGQVCTGRGRHRRGPTLGGERGAPHQRGARSSEGGERSGRPRRLSDVTARPAHRRMAGHARRMTPLPSIVLTDQAAAISPELAALKLLRVT